jgi:DNA-binding LytR/AlgR family response regulator
MTVDVAIVDDMLTFCELLENFIFMFSTQNEQRMEYSVDFEVRVFTSGEELLKSVKKENYMPELLFLDIEMPGEDGVSIGQYFRKTLKNNSIQIIYISAKKEYAMELFQNHPFDFLVKPVSEEDVFKVMREYVDVFHNAPAAFEFSWDRDVQKILVKDIYFFESFNRQVKIHTVSGIVPYYGKLKDILSGSLAKFFVQIHQSYIVNKNYIAEFRHDSVKLVGGEVIKISRKYQENVEQVISGRATPA